MKYHLIHAHDWMTYPAAIALAKMLKLPLVVHVHSLECDRSGSHPNLEIQKIEEYGFKKADQIIAVSHYTQSLIHSTYQIPRNKIEVVHNGVNLDPDKLTPTIKSQHNNSKSVLFLGRMTIQKGPDYFVEAAAQVVKYIPNVSFIMVGNGDMLPQIIARTHELGIFDRFHFTGHLCAAEVQTMYSKANVYVMPSVSEPFGITALESISCRTPVIISKQSGVAEVLKHVFKVDFWDINQLANFIIGLITYPELTEDMITMATKEIRQAQWVTSAQKILQIYQLLLNRG